MSPPAPVPGAPSRRRKKVLLGGLVALVLALASARFVIVQVGEWYRSIQEAAVFAEHLNGALRRVTYDSRLLRARQTFLVYLPPGYGNPAARDRRYPVVYLLHGCPGQPRDWLVKGHAHTAIEQLIGSGRAREMILVMPEGSGPRGRFDCTLFMDRADGAYPAESAFVRELVPLVDRRFRTVERADGRALVGLSSGGFAAVNLGVRHPDMFGVLAALSGYFRAVDDPRSVRSVLNSNGAAWAANSPANQIAAVPPALRPHIYLDVGTADPERAATEAFARELQQLGIDYELRVTPGSHTWRYWRRLLPDSLRWVSSRLRD